MRDDPVRYRNVSPELREVARSHRKQMTGAEQVLWNALRRGQLDGVRFRKQHPFEKFIFDFYCAEHWLILEVDGSIHDDADVAAHDREREVYLKNRGFTLLRFRNEEVTDRLSDVLARIQATLSR